MGRSIPGVRAMAARGLAAGLACACACVAGRAAEPAFDLGEFWPLDAPARTWNLTTRAELRSAQPGIRMTVENETVKRGEFILWFSNKKDQPAGKRDGELYRLCATADGAWLCLDAYIDIFPGKPPLRHAVMSDRIVYSPSGGPPKDLVESGLYRACGGIGQPYLLWSDAPASYRIQVWGHLAENPKFRWYWDATVTKDDKVTNEGLTPVRAVRAVRVEEAWWCNFKIPAGSWDLGTGALDPRDGSPSGRDVVYGRTVWHGEGRIPYLMIRGTHAPTGSIWCVNSIVAGAVRDRPGSAGDTNRSAAAGTSGGASGAGERGSRR